MESIDIDFDGSSSQVFLVGPGSCAVPGSVAGSKRPRALRVTSLAPADRARDRARPGRRGAHAAAGHLHAILDLILRHTPDGRAIYGEQGRITAGERVVMPDLAATLERLAEGGARELYGGARPVVSHLAERGLDHRTISPATA